MEAGGKRKSRWPLFLVGLAIFAAVMAGVSLFTLSTWGDLRTVELAEAQRTFAETLTPLGPEPPYVEISRTGEVHVNRDQERAQPVALRALHLLANDPGSGRLVDIAFPFWFVRLKMSRTLNLGNMTSFLVGDWEHLDLTVTEEDLERRGPGLVLDHTSSEGQRIVLWTE